MRRVMLGDRVGHRERGLRVFVFVFFTSYSLWMCCAPLYVCVTARPCVAVYECVCTLCVILSPTLAHTEPQHLPVFCDTPLKSLWFSPVPAKKDFRHFLTDCLNVALSLDAQAVGGGGGLTKVRNKPSKPRRVMRMCNSWGIRAI